MTAKLFARPIQKTVFPSEARETSLVTVLERAEKLLDGENLKCIYVVEGGHVVEGSEHATLLGDDGTVRIATIAEARGGDDEEDDMEDEPEDDEEGDDSEDDEEDSEDDDEEEDDEEDTDESATSRYEVIATAIANTGLPRKLKTMAAEALAARFEALPGAFNAPLFIRTAIATTAEDAESTDEGLQRNADLMAFKGDSGYTLAIRSKRGGWDIHGTDKDRLTSNPSKSLAAFNVPKEWGQRVPLGQLPKALQGDMKARLKANFGPSANVGEGLDEAALTRKHFAMIAQALAELDMPMNYKRELVGAVAGALQSLNDQFHRERFIKATGLTPSQVHEPETAGAASEMLINYCPQGIQLVNEDGEQIALVRCDTANHVESVRAINAVSEYASTLGYQHEPEQLDIDEDSTPEEDILEAEWDSIDDLRALMALTVEACSSDELLRFGSTLSAIDEAINEGDFELAEELAEPLLEYKRMGQSARRMRIRSIRTGIPKSVKSGKVTRSEHRRNLLKRRRMYRTSAGTRSKAKRYAKRYQRFRARLRPIGGRANESVILTGEQFVEACGGMKKRKRKGAPLPPADEARQTKEEKLLSAEVTKTYGKWFDRVQVPMLKLPAISNDIRALLASKANLDVEMPKLVAKYKVESVEEAGDKLGVLAGEVMTYLINRPRATAEDLVRKFRCSSSAAQSIMGVAAQALAAGEGKGDYNAHVAAIGKALAADNAFEGAEGEYRRPFDRALDEGERLKKGEGEWDTEFRDGANKKSNTRLVFKARGKTFRSAWYATEAMSMTTERDRLLTAANYYFVNGKLPAGAQAWLDESDVPTQHQTKIALSTLKMHALGARIMGGMNHAQAVRHLTTTAGYSAAKVRGLLKKAGHDDADIEAMFTAATTDEAEKPPYGSKGYQDHDYECREVFTSFKDCDLPAGHKGPHKMKKPKGDKADEARPDSDYSPNADALNALCKTLYTGAFKAARLRTVGKINAAVIGERASEGHIRKAKAMGKLEGRIAEYVEQLAQEDAMSEEPRDFDEVWAEVSMEFKDEPGFDFEESLDEALQLPTNGTHTIRDPESYGRPEATTIEVPAFKLAKATIFMPGGYGWLKREVNDLVLWQAKYAQYPAALHVQFREKGKRKTVANAYGSHARLIVYSGWGIDIEVEDPFEPEKPVPGIPGVTTRKGKRLSQDPGWDDEMLARVNNYTGKAPVVSIVEGACAWTPIDEETGKPQVSLGDVITLGNDRRRKYLVLGLDRWGNPYAHALSGTERGSQLSGAPPSGAGALAVVGKADGAEFSGKMAAKLRAKAEAQRQMLKGFTGATVWDGELPPVATVEDSAGHSVYEAEDGETMFQRSDGEPVSVDDVIRRGDRVTIYTPQKQKRTGTAVMRGPAGWVLNMGGAHGTPGIATDRNVSTIKRGKTVVYTDESIDESVPGIAKWHTFAGGTGAAEGKYSYQWNTPHGEYHLSPFTRNGGRHAGYMLKFANTAKGEGGKYLNKGLWIDLGVHRSPNAGAKAAREHDASIGTSESADPEYDAIVEARPSEPDDAMKAQLRKGAEAFHARGSSRSQARLGNVQLKPTGSSSAPPDFADPKNPQTKGKKGDEYTVSYKGKAIGTIRFDGSVWSSADTKGKRVSSHEGWSLRNAISQLLSGTMGDAWTSNESTDEALNLKSGDDYRREDKERDARQRKSMRAFIDAQVRGNRKYDFTVKEVGDGVAFEVRAKGDAPSGNTWADTLQSLARLHFGAREYADLGYNFKPSPNGGSWVHWSTSTDKKWRQIMRNPTSESIDEGAEDDLTNAIFNGTKVGTWFKQYASLAGDMLSAVTYDGFTCEPKALATALRTGGALSCSFQGSKAEARNIAREMIAAAEEISSASESVNEAEGAKPKPGDPFVLMYKYAKPDATWIIVAQRGRRATYVWSKRDQWVLIREFSNDGDPDPIAKRFGSRSEGEKALTSASAAWREMIGEARDYDESVDEAVVAVIELTNDNDASGQQEARDLAVGMGGKFREGDIDDETGNATMSFLFPSLSAATRFRKTVRADLRNKLVRVSVPMKDDPRYAGQEESVLDEGRTIEFEGYKIAKDKDGNYRITPPGGMQWREPAANLETAKRWISQHKAERRQRSQDFERKDEGLDEASIETGDSDVPEIGFKSGNYYLKTKNGAKHFPPEKGTREQRRTRFREKLRNEFNVASADSLIAKLDAMLESADDEVLDEAANGKVSTFRAVASSIFTQYDTQQAARAAKRRGGYHSPYAIGHYFEALDRAFEVVKGQESSEDPEVLRKLIASLKEEFEENFPPLKKLVGQIEAFIATGKKPTIVGQFKESIDEGVELPDGRVFDIKTGQIVEAVRKKLDFAEYEAKARRMSDSEIHYALLDIKKTLGASDSMDRETGSDEGGYYRDQASVLRKEVERRRKGGRREESTDEASSRPSLGKTVYEVLKGWREAEPASGSHQVVGFEVGFGTFQIDARGNIATVERSKSGVPITRPATKKQVEEIEDSIAKGRFQIENRPIRIGADLPRWVLHQATGRPLEGGDSNETEYTEAEYNALDEAKRKKMKGYWRTSRSGHRIFIENGKVTKGNPHVLKAVSGRR